MKRTLFIIAGLVIILLLIGVWAYFLFFGTPDPNGGVFTDFGFDSTNDPTIVATPPVIATPTVDVTSPERLRQLTTKPIAGFSEVQIATTTNPEVRYIEAGTGHIYSIDLTTGTEVRVSATTIPLANKGVITPNGQYVFIQSDTGGQDDVVIGIISTTSDELRNFAVSEPVTSFAATIENEILYTTPVGNQLLARVYNPQTSELRTIFTIPFRDATVSWNTSTAGPHVVYPHTTSRLEGYVYTYTNGVGVREASSGYGLSAVGSSDVILYSEQLSGEYRTFIQPVGTLEIKDAPLVIIPEKCTFSRNTPTVGVCGVALIDYSHLMPDPWYKGEITMNDSLWEINTISESANLLVSPETATGRQVDIVNPAFGLNDENLYFQNKRDQTLWVYEYNPLRRLTE
jgi:hypothetical protein